MTSRPYQRGISLVEAILASFLMGIVLLIVSDLTSSLNRVSTVSEKKDSTLVLRTVAQRLRASLEEAVEIQTPTNNTPVATVILTRLKAEGLAPSLEAGARLPSPPAIGTDFNWDPISAARLEVITYDLDGTSMRRKVDSGTAQTIATVKSFEARQREVGLFEIKLELDSPAKQEIVKCVVARR